MNPNTTYEVVSINNGTGPANGYGTLEGVSNRIIYTMLALTLPHAIDT